MSLKKNSIYNFIGLLLPIVLSLLTIPLFLKHIGEARYGIVSVVWVLLAYFSLFDMGLSRAIVKSIASINQDANKLDEIFWTGLTMNLSFGLIGGLSLGIFADVLVSNFLNIDGYLKYELNQAVPWVALCLPITILSGFFSSVLQGRQEFIQLNFFAIFNAALIQILPLYVAVEYGPSLSNVVIAILMARLIGGILLFIKCIFFVVKQPPIVSWTLAKKLLSFGSWVTLTSLISPFMVVLDRFVIGALIGAEAVARYSIPFQLTEKLAIIPQAITGALFPQLAVKDQASNELVKSTVVTISLILTPTVLIAIFLTPYFFSWWLNEDFSKAVTLPTQILLIGFWANSLARVPYTYLQASGNPSVVAKCHISELVPYLLLLCGGIYFWGLLGVAIAFSARVIVDCIALYYFSGNLVFFLKKMIYPLSLLVCGFLIAFNFRILELTWIISITLLMILTIAFCIDAYMSARSQKIT